MRPGLSSVQPIIEVFGLTELLWWSNIKNPPISRDVIGEEDNCLTLNVYTRSVLLPRQEDLLLPVMVWIHGGGFAWGSGSDLLYGPQRAMNQAIVLVTINYRLGPLGFMTGGGSSGDCPQNIGLHDQRYSISSFVIDTLGEK